MSRPGPPRPARPPAVATAPGPPALAWFRVHAGTTVLDTPLRSPPGAQLWAATLWPDPTQPIGWTRRRWRPGPAGRGLLPAALELADVVEFGATLPDRHGRTGRRPAAVCWYGYTHAITPDGLTLRGPYPGPHEAHAAAQQALLHLTQTQAHTAAQHSGRPPLSTPDPDTAMVPGQPPVALSITFHGPTATVGDPHHGWLTVPTERFTAAMRLHGGVLASHLRSRAAGLYLNEREARVTLAALAARHTPDVLATPSARPPGPAGGAAAAL